MSTITAPAQAFPETGPAHAQFDAAAMRAALGTRAIVLVGMMGSGKSSVGRRLANRLDLPFVDADTEIEIAAGISIPEIFALHGEETFRSGERRVIARLLAAPRAFVLATGGGAYMNEKTRECIAERGISIWLKADPDVLMQRVRKRPNRPLLQTSDPETALRALLAQREPIYAHADITVISPDAPHEIVVEMALDSLKHYLASDRLTKGDRHGAD